MPTIPRSNKCNHLQCSNNKAEHGGYCIEHGGRNSYKSNRADKGSKHYNSKSWARLRVAQLSKQPLCQSCLLKGKTTPAEHVDHVWAWQSIGDYAFSQNLFQSLCQPCHSVKTGKERRGIYEHYGEQRITEYAHKDYDKVVLGI